MSDLLLFLLKNMKVTYLQGYNGTVTRNAVRWSEYYQWAQASSPSVPGSGRDGRQCLKGVLGTDGRAL